MPAAREFLFLVTVQALAGDSVLLDEVRGRVPLARARAPRTPDIAKLDFGWQPLLQPVPDGAPGPHVLRLLLRPDALGHVRIAGEELVIRRERERVELLEPGDSDALGGATPLVTDDVVVDLPGAEDEAARPPPSLFVERGVVQDRTEAPLHEVLEIRRGLRQSQQALRREEDEWARLRVKSLAADDMEVLRRGRAVHDSNVLLRGHLHEALDPRARVLRAASFVAVRKQKREPRALLPLREARHDELVDDHLRRV